MWDGNYTTSDIVQQFHACNYRGSVARHLCWHESSHLGALRKGQITSNIRDFHRVFDNSYTQVGRNYSSTGDIVTGMVADNFTRFEYIKSPTDSHEFHAVGNGESYVQTVYARKTHDLTPWTDRNVTWVLDSCFQEIEFVTERIIFSWCYLDHLPLETHIYLDLHDPNQTTFHTTYAGDGTWFAAWDFFHVNSVDKNAEGDYLISGRHADQIMKIAGPSSPNGLPGAVLWRLGGPSNQFEFRDNFTFSRQHDARFVSTTEEWTWFTVFDNAWEGDAGPLIRSANYSSGKLIAVNNVTMKASLIQEYPHPEGHLCRSGGSVQMLPNKNMFVGWGFNREITEFAHDGTVLFHAHLEMAEGPNVNNYRNFKFQWTGEPAAPPKLLAYARQCAKGVDSPLVAYVSWNGATEVESWHFRVSDTPGHWIDAGIFEKTAFETKAVLSDWFWPRVHVEALDSNGRVLSSTIARTFVPNSAIAADCDAEGCSREEHRTYDAMFSCADDCAMRHRTSSAVAFATLLICIELLSLLASAIIRFTADRSLAMPPGNYAVALLQASEKKAP